MSYNKGEDMTERYYTENEDILNLKNVIEKIHSKMKNSCLLEDTNTSEDVLELSRKLDNIIAKYNSEDT